ncbi:MAG TPA: L-2-hydroxyglutarate oxidase [Candidatus Aminicenantes bacterium]|nr:L-2-hydroxyglutarate oxidase [Candidatus Aminicenantes bacterium]
MAEQTYGAVVIGGGIVGTATAMALSGKVRGGVVVLEKEDRLAAHQTGNNSGVIHSGLYYRPGSLKARNCTQGREALYRFCAENSIPHQRCGKLVVATREAEIPGLERLAERGEANGLTDMRRLRGPDELRAYEPHVHGLAGLWVPQTGIVDYHAVTAAFAERIRENEGEIRMGARFISRKTDGDTQVLETTSGTIRCRMLVNCAGLQSDRVARACGVNPGLKIIPFRGEYYVLRPERESLVNGLIYPVPDPKFPFLGVHFTRMIGGGVEAGPNAVPAFRREGYRKLDISLRDMAETFLYRGFMRMGVRHFGMGVGEMVRSWIKPAFVASLRCLIPEISGSDVQRGGAGVRAQALEPDGTLVDDFRIVEAPGMVHVLNAPSPAATAAITIGETIAARVMEQIKLKS